MAPVKKQKANKSPKTNEKQSEKPRKADESVVSGQLQKKINKKQQKPQKDPRGVVFIKHLPHGFFEEQLQKYFEQFGNVTRVRLARSSRTGNSKGYAFVEFEYPEVAEVAAETMDNYLMFKKIIKASYIPPEKQQFNYFRSTLKKIRNKSGKMVWVSKKTASIQSKMHKHNDWSEENFQKRTQKQLQKLKKMSEKYAHLGIDINEFIVEPKILTEKAKKLKEKKASTAKKEKNEKKAGISKSVLRNISKDELSSNKQNSKKLKNKLSLEDLLGDTIQEESEDDDYVVMDDSEEESGESSDEETYGFDKETDHEDDIEKDQESENESEEEASPIVKNKLKKSFGKTLKSSNVERFDQMLKRKPLTGGINKLNKKPLKQPSIVAKNKKALQISAAKEIAKPLSKVKGKLNRPLKAKKNLIKIK